MPAACLGCDRNALEPLLDLGPQPPSNRFCTSDSPDDTRHPLALMQCRQCGLVQLADPMPVDAVRSRFEWLSYNEPEGHLDRLVERLATDCALAPNARVLGVTYKDDTTIARLARLGFKHSYRLDAATDLEIRDPRAGLETIQGALDPARAGALAARHGQADLLIARHVLEHAHDPRAFLQACLTLLKPGGWLVLEMPDSTKFLAAHDYCFIWEEHITYFTPATLRTFLGGAGGARVEVFSFPYALEDSLIGLLRTGNGGTVIPVPCDVGQRQLAAELARGRAFAAGFPERSRQLKRHLEGLQVAGKRIAGFGAGHLAAKFVNFHGLAGLIDCIVDDNPHKQGLRMPGSGLEIVGSAILEREHIDLCLLSLSPESEAKVLANKRGYLDRGGEFRSMFSLSPLALAPVSARV